MVNTRDQNTKNMKNKKNLGLILTRRWMCFYGQMDTEDLVGAFEYYLEEKNKDPFKGLALSRTILQRRNIPKKIKKQAEKQLVISIDDATVKY
jgi:hypothetical protein